MSGRPSHGASGACELCGGPRRRRLASFPVTTCSACRAPVCAKHVRYVPRRTRLLRWLTAHNQLDPVLSLFMGEKLCAGCGAWKGLVEFGPSSLSADGRDQCCRACSARATDEDRQLCSRCLRSEPAEVRQAAIAMVG